MRSTVDGVLAKGSRGALEGVKSRGALEGVESKGIIIVKPDKLTPIRRAGMTCPTVVVVEHNDETVL